MTYNVAPSSVQLGAVYYITSLVSCSAPHHNPVGFAVPRQEMSSLAGALLLHIGISGALGLSWHNLQAQGPIYSIVQPGAGITATQLATPSLPIAVPSCPV